MLAVALEGLPCVGKTSVAEAMAQDRASVTVIREVVLSRQCGEDPTARDDFFWRNEKAKSDLLRAHREQKRCSILLLDRYFLSTVVCCALRQQGHAAQLATGTYLLERGLSTLECPDVWILVEERPDRVWNRMHAHRRLSAGDPWADPENVEVAAFLYEALMPKLADSGQHVLTIACNNFHSTTPSMLLAGCEQ